MIISILSLFFFLISCVNEVQVSSQVAQSSSSTQSTSSSSNNQNKENIQVTQIIEEDTESEIFLGESFHHLDQTCEVRELKNIQTTSDCFCDELQCSIKIISLPHFSGQGSFEFNLLSNGELITRGIATIHIQEVNDAPEITFSRESFIVEKNKATQLSFSLLDHDDNLTCEQNVTLLDSDLTPEISLISISEENHQCHFEINLNTDQQMGILRLTASDGKITKTYEHPYIILSSDETPLLSSSQNMIEKNEDAPSFDLSLSLTGSEKLSCTDIVAMPSELTEISLSGTIPNCTATLTPFSQKSGEETLTFYIFENQPVHVSLTINPVDDPAIIDLNHIPSRLTFTEDGEEQSFYFRVIDPDSEVNCQDFPLPSSSLVDLTLGQVNNENETLCVITLSPKSQQNGYQQLSFFVGNQEIPISIVVDDVDDAPEILLSEITINEDQIKQVNLSYWDPDSEMASSCHVTSPLEGLISNPCHCERGICSFEISPPKDYFGNTSAKLSVTTGTLTSEEVEIPIFIKAIDDPPQLIIDPSEVILNGDHLVLNIMVQDVDSQYQCNQIIPIKESQSSFYDLSPVTGIFPQCEITLSKGQPLLAESYEESFFLHLENTSLEVPVTMP